jgi:hypothetical protein
MNPSGPRRAVLIRDIFGRSHGEWQGVRCTSSPVQGAASGLPRRRSSGDNRVMDTATFRCLGHQLVDWNADYRDRLEAIWRALREAAAGEVA